MLRKFVCAAVIVVIGVGVVMADEFNATISKVDGDKVTFKKRATKKGESTEEMTLPVAKNAKILKGKFNASTLKLDAGDPLENGLKNEIFTKIDDGINVKIATDADNKNITAITVGGKAGKPKQAQ